MLWPTNGHVVELELHGLELVRIEVDITICNFESLDGSLAVYGTGASLARSTTHPVFLLVSHRWILLARRVHSRRQCKAPQFLMRLLPSVACTDTTHDNMGCEFDVTGGETKLQDIWRPKNGRQNISIELPFPQSSGLDDSIVMLQAGRAIEYTIELSLMDGGYEIGATASLALALVSAHVPRINPSAPGVLHEKPFIYLLRLPSVTCP